MCGKEMSLFNDAVRRVLLPSSDGTGNQFEEKLSAHGQSTGTGSGSGRNRRLIVDKNDTCFCAIQGPSVQEGAAEFVRVFNETIDELIRVGQITPNFSIIDFVFSKSATPPSVVPNSIAPLSNPPSIMVTSSERPVTSPIPSGSNLTELVRRENCDMDSGLEYFESSALIEFESAVSAATAVQANELDLLSVAFGDSYNGLQEANCDPLARSVRNVSIVILSSLSQRRQLVQESGLASADPLSGSEHRYSSQWTLTERSCCFPWSPDANSRVEPVKGNIPSNQMNTESQTSKHKTSKFEFSLELIIDIAQPFMSSLSV
jgi:hypothetical protein